jgi:hypothetical protein
MPGKTPPLESKIFLRSRATGSNNLAVFISLRSSGQLLFEFILIPIKAAINLLVLQDFPSCQIQRRKLAENCWPEPVYLASVSLVKEDAFFPEHNTALSALFAFSFP